MCVDPVEVNGSLGESVNGNARGWWEKWEGRWEGGMLLLTRTSNGICILLRGTCGMHVVEWRVSVVTITHFDENWITTIEWKMGVLCACSMIGFSFNQCLLQLSAIEYTFVLTPLEALSGTQIHFMSCNSCSVLHVVGWFVLHCQIWNFYLCVWNVAVPC